MKITIEIDVFDRPGHKFECSANVYTSGNWRDIAPDRLGMELVASISKPIDQCLRGLAEQMPLLQYMRDNDLKRKL